MKSLQPSRVIGALVSILGILIVSFQIQKKLNSESLVLLTQVVTTLFILLIIVASFRKKPHRESILRGSKLIPYSEARRRASRNSYRSLLFGFLNLPLKIATSHFAIIGATGSGKTITIRLLMQSVLPFIRKGEDSRAIIYDAKGEMEGLVRGMTDSIPIYNLNPFSSNGTRWDVASDIKDPASCLQLAVALLPDEKRDSQPYFVQTARHLLSGLLIVFNKRAPGAWTLRDVLLGVGDLDRLEGILGLEEETKNRLLHFSDKRTLDNVYSTLLSKLQNYEFIASAWERSKTSISLSEFLESESIIILGNSEITREAIDEINRVIFRRLTELILGSDESDSRYTWVILDEVRQAGKIDSLNSLLTKGRSKGACCVLGFQDIEGMRHVYGRELANELIGQCHNKAILKLLSPETADWASKIFGEYESLSLKKSESQSTYSLFRGSVSSTKNRSNRRSVISSEFTSLPSTSLTNGLSGFYSIKDIGSYSVTVSGKSLREALIEPKETTTKSSLCQITSLTPWNESDLIRLGIKNIKRSKRPSTELKQTRKRGLI